MNETNLNLSKCIVEKTHFGYDTMINICNGRSVDVAWTFGDWFRGSVLALLLLLLLVGIVGVAAMIVGAIREGSL